jgi:hypothetical protein
MATNELLAELTQQALVLANFVDLAVEIIRTDVR